MSSFSFNMHHSSSYLVIIMTISMCLDFRKPAWLYALHLHTKT